MLMHGLERQATRALGAVATRLELITDLVDAPKGHGTAALQLMRRITWPGPLLPRLSEFREQLRQLLPGPLEWRALQMACRWSRDTSPGPLQEVHRRPKLRTRALGLRRRLRRKPLNDLLSLTGSLEDLRFAVELMGARPRQAGKGRVAECLVVFHLQTL